MGSDVERSSQDIVNSLSLQDTFATENHQWSVECEMLWHRVKDVQEKLENVPPRSLNIDEIETREISSDSVQTPDQVYRILQEYEKRLKAELAFLQGQSTNNYSSSNKEVQYIILQQDQRRQKQHLKETLSHVKAKHSSLIDSIAQEDDMNSTLKKVEESLKAKNTLMSQSASNDEVNCSSSAAISDMKAKIDKVKQANKYFQNGLKLLLSLFPSPSPNEQRRRPAKNALDSTRDFDEDSFMSLSSIIGKLMEQTLNSPEQPYINITERMWPQHIEFLLRSQIVVKDPENSLRMKLVPFHL